MQLQPMPRVAPFVAAVTGAGACPFPPAMVPSEAVAPGSVLPMPWMLIRRLGACDRAALAGHLIGLPPEDRCARFGGPSPDDVIRRHCDALDLEETVCFAALDKAGRVVAAALGFPCGAAGGRRLVEVAVSVAPEHRRRRLGGDLVARVCAVGAERGAEGAVFEFDPGNAAMRGLVRHLGGWVTPLAASCLIPFSAPY